MPGSNTTGKPNVRDYVLGRGIVYFAPLDTNGLPTAYRDLGNAPEFSLSVESETLDHESSRTGLKFTDAQVTLRQKVGVKFSLDEFNDENLAALLSGTQNANTNAVTTAGFAEREMISSVQLGRWYDITNAAGARAFAITAGDLTVEKQGAPDVALVLGTDYELDTVFGRIFFKSTAVNCAAGDKIDVTLAAHASPKAVDEVRGLTQVAVKGALKFISDNAADDGKKREFQFHRLSLKANGDIALIGDDWGKMDFEGASERNEAAEASSPTLTVRTVKD